MRGRRVAGANAVVESLWASLKNELAVQRTFATKQEAQDAVFESIVVWYNRKRRHSSLGYLSPQAFEAKQNRTEPNRSAHVFRGEDQTLLDAERYPAQELVVRYHQRWEIEIDNDELATHQLALPVELRNRTP